VFFIFIIEDPNDYPCSASPTVPHSYTTVIQGYQSENVAIPGTVVQIRCFSKYKNTKAPCQPGKLRCIGGRWVGIAPVCGKIPSQSIIYKSEMA
jgi:hypothetical protein